MKYLSERKKDILKAVATKELTITQISELLNISKRCIAINVWQLVGSDDISVKVINNDNHFTVNKQ